MSAASTPCVRICVIDPRSGLCEGCGRSLQEIAQWSRLSETERLAIMAVLEGRLAVPSETPPRVNTVEPSSRTSREAAPLRDPS